VFVTPTSESLTMQLGPPYGTGPEPLQLFVAGLSGLAPEEVRQAKRLYLRNQLSQLRVLQTQMGEFRVVQGCLAVFPPAWLYLWTQRSRMHAAMTMGIEQVRNAMDIWKDDLGSDVAELERELRNLTAAPP
jgi:hypothetical protein